MFKKWLFFDYILQIFLNVTPLCLSKIYTIYSKNNSFSPIKINPKQVLRNDNIRYSKPVAENKYDYIELLSLKPSVSLKRRHRWEIKNIN